MNLDQFQGVNAGYVLELHERYLQDPTSVDATTREAFERWSPDQPEMAVAAARIASSEGLEIHLAVGAANYAESIRRYGHLAARVDPLGSEPVGDPSLSSTTHGITDDDLRRLPASLIGGPTSFNSENALEAIEKLRRVYCETTGFDLAQIFVPEERNWLRDVCESGRFLPPLDDATTLELLERITQVEVFEQFLHRTFPGKTRFSLEGLDLLVPVLEEIIRGAGTHGIRHTLIGMAHRGRLNVLAHVLNKSYAQILAEFKDPIANEDWRQVGWMGDVKYHAGARTSSAAGQMFVSMAPNPSHLEAVNPIVVGMARAAGTQTDHAGMPVLDHRVTLPILIHGDAAFQGQGVVAETLNLSQLAGYDTGGTIHIIANNQLGFTTTPHESYSTSYASGVARGFKIPIMHVNADDPVACLEAARIAREYLLRYQKDCLIDLIGYRRYGHNEGDEPAFTQPVMYEAIATHPTVRSLWSTSLVAAGKVSAEVPDEVVRKHFSTLESTLASMHPDEDVGVTIPKPAPAGIADSTETGVPLDQLRELNEGLLDRPSGFTMHRKLVRARDRRRSILDKTDERTIDWAAAEELAMATILADGVPIRLTGEDVARGTFSHRHAVFHDTKTGDTLVPLQRLPQAKASFEIHNSPLTENATIGFECGYNLQAPQHLVMWEAQYGDFINGAQVMLDEFVTSGRSKWGLTPSLVFLLPHGYEGQGPDHSTARPERLLQAAADINLRLVNCTTAAQYFHVLRRQAVLLERDPLPLFILTPKSLLRHPATASAPGELAQGRFLSVIDDAAAASRASDVRRLILCSGKVFVDLDSSELRPEASHVAICRLEQLYPFPEQSLATVLNQYPNLEDMVWVQEEPENFGAWAFLRPLLIKLLARRCPLRYIGRERLSSPSEGSQAWHQLNQKMLVERAFDPGGGNDESIVLSKQIRSVTGKP